MKTQFSRVMKRCVGGAVLAAALAAAPAGWGQAPLAASGSASALVLLDPLFGATQVGATMNSNYDSGGYKFTVTSAVFTFNHVTPLGFGEGKLVFEYKITNDLAPNIDTDLNDGVLKKWGITLFDVTGFQGVQTSVAQVDENGTDSGDGLGVNPGVTLRSSDGNTITFTYPPVVAPGDPSPPIYAGEFSRRLLVFTDATSFTTVSSVITNTDIDFAGRSFDDGGELVNGSVTQSVYAYAPSVPDSASTSGLIGLALVLLAAGFRMRASSRG